MIQSVRTDLVANCHLPQIGVGQAGALTVTRHIERAGQAVPVQQIGNTLVEGMPIIPACRDGESGQ
jgi:hypothetical protein